MNDAKKKKRSYSLKLLITQNVWVAHLLDVKTKHQASLDVQSMYEN